jgi:hypothetical protein
VTDGTAKIGLHRCRKIHSRELFMVMEEITIDFRQVNEGFLRMFGTWVSTILKAMFGGQTIPLTVRGTRSQVESFAKVLDKEKKYMEAWHQYGLDSPATYQSKFKLNRAISEFERKTSLKWPFQS